MVNRYLSAGLLAALVVLASVVPASGVAGTSCGDAVSAPINLDSGVVEHMIGRAASVLYDAEGKLDYEGIRRADLEGRFARHCRADFEPPPDNGALWIRFDVRRTAAVSPDWVVSFGEREIDEARLYLTQPNNLFVLKRSGRDVPRSARDVVSRWPALGLFLEPARQTPVYIRLAGISAPFLSMRLVPEKLLADKEGGDLLALAAVLGFMLAMLVYNLVLYVRSRLHHCLFYLLYLAFMIVHIALYDGLIYRFTDINLSGRFADNLAHVFAVAAGIGLLMFGRALLGLSRLAPRADTIVLFFVLAVIAALALDVLAVLPGLMASTTLIILSGIFMCGCAAFFAAKGHRPAVYFFLSFLAVLVGAIFDVIGFYWPVALDPEPSFWTSIVGIQQNWSFHVGICAEAVLISFAITYFIRDMQADVAGARADAETSRREAVAARHDFEDKLAAMAHRIGVRERIADRTAAMFSPRSSDDAFLEKAVGVVHEYLADEAFDVTRLADELAVSERSLRRRLNQATGLSPVEFIRRERLEQGRYFLQTGSYRTVAEVARAVGIASPGYFSRLYREAFGHPPSEARKA